MYQDTGYKLNCYLLIYMKWEDWKMFCTKCGFELDDDSLFCANCGSKVKVFAPKKQHNQVLGTSVKDEDTKMSLVEQAVIPEPVMEEQPVIPEPVMEEQPVILEPIVEEQPVISEPVILEQPIIPESKEEQVVINENVEEDKKISSDIENVEEDNSFAEESFVNNQVSETNQQNNYNPYIVGNTQNNVPVNKKGKFSVKRLIFSMLVIIASVTACVSIFKLPYSELTMNMKMYEYEEAEVKKINESYTIIDLMLGRLLKGDTDEKIIKPLAELSVDDITDMADFAHEILDESEDLKENAELVMILSIVLIVVIGFATIINIVLCCAFRKKVTYVLTLLLSMINLGIAGFIFYLFNFDMINQVSVIVDYVIMDFGYTVNVDFMADYTIGSIVLLVSELVIFISSIVLLTCKNNKK